MQLLVLRGHAIAVYFYINKPQIRINLPDLTLTFKKPHLENADLATKFLFLYRVLCYAKEIEGGAK